jgi:streptogramin lyase
LKGIAHLDGMRSAASALHDARTTGQHRESGSIRAPRGRRSQAGATQQTRGQPTSSQWNSLRLSPSPPCRERAESERGQQHGRRFWDDYDRSVESRGC